jgi:hypothetical protein
MRNTVHLQTAEFGDNGLIFIRHLPQNLLFFLNTRVRREYTKSWIGPDKTCYFFVADIGDAHAAEHKVQQTNLQEHVTCCRKTVQQKNEAPCRTPGEHEVPERK